MELMRATEAAALAGGRWMGRGDKNAADGAAVEAMRLVLSSVSMDGVVVIGEGEKDEAPMLFNGEQIGDGSQPSLDIAVDPIDGTTLTSLGRAGAIAVIAMSERGTMFDPGPCVYMEKIAAGPAAADAIDLNAPVTREPRSGRQGARREGQRRHRGDPRPRPPHRHHPRVPRGGRAHPLIPDGDVAGAISVAWRNSGTDVLFGIGGTPEGVIAACALKCLGGAIQGRLWPRERRRAPGRRSTPATTSTGCSRSTTSSPATTCSSRRPASPTASCCKGVRYWGDGAGHAEPRHALEVGDDPHHRRDAPLDEADVVLRDLVRLSPGRPAAAHSLHVGCTNLVVPRAARGVSSIMDHTDGAVGVLDPVDAAPAAPDPEPGRADPTAGETVFDAPGPLHRPRSVRSPRACCTSLAMIDHRGHTRRSRRAFLAIAAIQIVWGVLLIVEPRKIFVLLGGLATAGAILGVGAQPHEGHLVVPRASRTSKASDGATSSRSSPAARGRGCGDPVAARQRVQAGRQADRGDPDRRLRGASRCP